MIIRAPGSTGVAITLGLGTLLVLRGEARPGRLFHPNEPVYVLADDVYAGSCVDADRPGVLVAGAGR